MAVKKDSKQKPAAAPARSGKVDAAVPPAVVPAAATPATAAGGTVAASLKEASFEDFSRVIVGMSRLLVGFGELKPLQDAGLGLGEWVVLGLVARHEGVNNKLMSRSLGIPMQRITQISASLAQNGLVAPRQTVEGGKPGKAIKVTEAGKAKLAAVNAELKTMLGTTLKPHSLGRVLRQLRPLERVLRAARPEKAAKKEGMAKPVPGASDGRGAAAAA